MISLTVLATLRRQVSIFRIMQDAASRRKAVEMTVSKS